MKRASAPVTTKYRYKLTSNKARWVYRERRVFGVLCTAEGFHTRLVAIAWAKARDRPELRSTPKEKDQLSDKAMLARVGTGV